MLPRWLESVLREKHRGVLVVVALLVLGLCSWAALTAPVRNDVVSMLPDSGSLVQEFNLIQQAPLAGKVVINLHVAPQGDFADLNKAANLLSDILPGEVITKVIDGPQDELGPRLVSWLVRHTPVLLDVADMAKLDGLTSPDAVRAAMQQNYRDLLSPQGAMLKQLVRVDPLRLRTVLFPKLKSLNFTSVAKVHGGHFVSADHRNLLLIAETPVSMTDSDGAARLVGHLEEVFSRLPENVTATYVAGHRHTLANERVIHDDIIVAFAVSLVLLALVFVMFLRRLTALVIFLVPCGVLVAALACTRVLFGEISGIVVGFGAVLVGISVDFAVHVYFACAGAEESRSNRLGGIVRPLLFGVLTSLGAFGALMFSSAPAIRQLAVFTMCGLVCSLLLSLLVLPHLLRRTTGLPGGIGLPWRVTPKVFGAMLIAFLVVFGAGAVNVKVDGDLRSLGYMSPELLKEEADVRSIWGGMDDSIMAFTPDAPAESGLRVNDEAYTLLTSNAPEARVSSLASILPSIRTQQARSDAWKGFWTNERQESVARNMEKAAAEYGFSVYAFEPFRRVLAEAPPVVTPDIATAAGLGELLALFHVPSDGGGRFISLVSEEGGVDSALLKSLKGLGMSIASILSVKATLERAIRNDTLRFLCLSSFAVLLLLSFLFRDPRLVLAAILPSACAVLAITGIAGMTGAGLNLFSVTAFPIVLGLCTDYGIYMVHVSLGKTDETAMRATLVSGLTTLAGFGPLALTAHPALHAIGTSVLLGIGVALPAALFLTPVVVGRGK
nr:MMPL family transporter [Pseudodesulfovibrio sp.]